MRYPRDEQQLEGATTLVLADEGMSRYGPRDQEQGPCGGNWNTG